MEQTLALSPCNATDIDCVCKSKTIIAAASECLAENCSVKDQLSML